MSVVTLRKRITTFPCFYIHVLNGHFLAITTIEPPFHTMLLLFEKKGVSTTDGGFETQTGNTYTKTLHCILAISRWIIF
jgi:hypothetical protein